MLLRILTTTACLALFAGCALNNPRVTPIAIAPLAGHDFADAKSPRAAHELLAVNDDMRAFVEQYVNLDASRQRRIEQLTRAVLHPGTLGLEYQDRMTRTAAEAFSTTNGNCLTLSMLFVALAREAGIEADFYAVDVVPEWTLAGDIVFATRHINVGGKLGSRSTYVMDFSPYIARREIGRTKLSDAQAIAQYYNNIGAEYLANGELASAYRQFVAGIALAPRISFLWSNLAVVFSRNNQRSDARDALRFAIRLDPENTSAMTNLAHQLQLEGDQAAADALAARIASVQRDNPYYQFALGERHLAEARYAEALTQIQRAIDLQPREPLFYHRASAAARKLGDNALVATLKATAERLDEQEQSRRQGRLNF
ncbi:MAG: transglutaminase domain-containing protein [Pseudomonadota bacterium]